jgi:hypothetical protein
LPSNLPIDGHSFRRVEVLTGTPRRRRWSAAEKAAIVAESLAPGVVMSAVALRYGLHRNQLETSNNRVFCRKSGVCAGGAMSSLIARAGSSGFVDPAFSRCGQTGTV